MAFVRLSPAEFTSAGRAAIFEHFDRVEDEPAYKPRNGRAAPRPRKAPAEPAIEADLEWDEQRPA